MTETVEVSVLCRATIRARLGDVKGLEQAVIAEASRIACQLYVEVMKAYQQQWLQQRRQQYQAVRWRRVDWVTPFGPIALPTRVIRERGVRRGGYHSLAKMLLRGRATRWLSPAVERQAVEAAVEQNYRPAARRVSRGCQTQISHGTVWRCVQYYGAKLEGHLDRGWWPDRPLGLRAAAVVTQMDSTVLRWQRRRRRPGQPRVFAMHLGLHYTGRRRGEDGRVALENKSWLVSAGRLGVFGARLRRQRDRHYGVVPRHQVVVSDGEEGLEWIRERQFEEAVWLLDRWHLGERVRGYVGQDRGLYRQIMAGVWGSDSEAVLRALRQTERGLGRVKPQQFRELFGYVLGNREGIDGYRQLPAALRRRHNGQEATVRAGSGAVEKNIEVKINRRFKKQGRSWNPVRADRLAQLLWLQQQPGAWPRWWNRVCLTTVKVNPGWAATDN